MFPCWWLFVYSPLDSTSSVDDLWICRSSDECQKHKKLPPQRQRQRWAFRGITTRQAGYIFPTVGSWNLLRRGTLEITTGVGLIITTVSRDFHLIVQYSQASLPPLISESRQFSAYNYLLSSESWVQWMDIYWSSLVLCHMVTTRPRFYPFTEAYHLIRSDCEPPQMFYFNFTFVFCELFRS